MNSAKTAVRFGSLAAGVVALAGVPASATWSIIIIDTRTREVSLGSATCLTNFDLQAGTPILLVGIGGGTAQSYVDASGQNRVVVRDQIQAGTDPEEILAILEAFDTGHQTRQYGLADVLGRAATFSGTGAGAWAGGQTGTLGDLVYAVQGNVLTGEPVVTAAVQAIIDTPGDVPAKMMAAMEAARVMGGDGRCSCNGGAPDSCGAPPPDFEKTAHIAYMLTARIGDRDGGNGIYRAGSSPFGLAAHDFNGDGLPDLVAGSSASNNLPVLINQTRPGDVFATFAPADPVLLPAFSRDVAVRDLNGDGRADLIAANSSANTVSVLPGLMEGGFGAPNAYPVGTDPKFLVIADLDDDGALDIATANINGSSISILWGDGSGGFGAADHIAVGGNMSHLTSADLDGDGLLDLTFTGQALGSLPTIYNKGNRTFQFGSPISTGGSPRWVLAHDFDHDGLTDLACATGTGGTVCLLLNKGGTFEREDLACGGTTVTLAVGDANGDGKDDLFVMRSSPQDFLVYTGDDEGGFLSSGPFVNGTGNFRAVPADLDGDGLDDLAAIAGGTKSVYIMQNRGDAGGPVDFDSGLGTATGDYFMEFNIAFAQQQDPDPVFTLQAMFDQWRLDLLGRPDAVASQASVEPDVLPADGESEAVLVVTLLDWQGEPVAESPGLTVEHAPESDSLSEIGEVTDLGGGQFSITVTAGTSPGADVLRVIADDGVRPVTLMPDVTLTLGPACAADCDGDGALSLFDFLCFVNRFNGGEPGADCDASGGLDLFDFLCFTNAYNAGC
jgi:hypothetical protein